MTAGQLGIVELGDVCSRMHAENMVLFHELGSWATADGDAAHRRWFATACHRHAWHAELWAQRAPTIPNADPDVVVAAPHATRLPAAPDAHAYATELRALLADLDRVSSRVDADLDPATARVLTLVRNDVVELLPA